MLALQQQLQKLLRNREQLHFLRLQPSREPDLRRLRGRRQLIHGIQLRYFELLSPAVRSPLQNLQRHPTKQLPILLCRPKQGSKP